MPDPRAALHSASNLSNPALALLGRTANHDYLRLALSYRAVRCLKYRRALSRFLSSVRTALRSFDLQPAIRRPRHCLAESLICRIGELGQCAPDTAAGFLLAPVIPKRSRGDALNVPDRSPTLRRGKNSSQSMLIFCLQPRKSLQTSGLQRTARHAKRITSQ